MDDDIVTRLREHLAHNAWKHGTHYAGCMTSHPLCALAWALDEIERLRALVTIGDDLAYWLEDYATFDDDDSRARTLIKCWKHYREEARRG